MSHPRLEGFLFSARLCEAEGEAQHVHVDSSGGTRRSVSAGLADPLRDRVLREGGVALTIAPLGAPKVQGGTEIVPPCIRFPRERLVAHFISVCIMLRALGKDLRPPTTGEPMGKDRTACFAHRAVFALRPPLHEIHSRHERANDAGI